LLRYELSIGSKERVELTSKSIIHSGITNTTLETINQRTEFPTVRSRMSLGVTEQRDGRARITRVVDDAVLDADGTTDASARRALERDIAKRRGETTSSWMTPAGEVFEAAGDPSSGVAINELLKIAVQADNVRFPDEPVGVGAAWRLTSHRRLQGVEVERVQTIRVAGLADHEISLATETVMTAAPQDLVVQPNATTKLTGLRFRVTATIVVSLRGLASIIYGEGRGEINLVVRQRGLKVTSATTIDSVFTTTPLAHRE